MNKREIGKKFEREAYEILITKFDKVRWLSKYKQVPYDFECFKNGKKYRGDAKFLTNGKITLRFTQKDADFVIAKVSGKIIFLWKEEFGEDVLIEKFRTGTIRIEKDLLNKLNILKYDFKCKTIDKVIRKLLELATPKLNNACAPKEPSAEERENAEKEVGGTLNSRKIREIKDE